jgi:hypothetical protein
MNDDSPRTLFDAVRGFRERAVSGNLEVTEAPGTGTGWGVTLFAGAQYPRLFVPERPDGNLMIDAGHSMVLATQGRLKELGLSNLETAALLDAAHR